MDAEEDWNSIHFWEVNRTITTNRMEKKSDKLKGKYFFVTQFENMKCFHMISTVFFFHSRESCTYTFDWMMADNSNSEKSMKSFEMQ